MASEKQTKRARRHKRVRAKIHGTAEIPRLCVVRSSQHIYANIIDDEKGRVIVQASDLKISGRKNKTERAAEVGKKAARLAKGKEISKVVFDRGGNKYHGRVKALAEGAREGGLKF